MTKIVKLRRGTTIQHSTFTGAEGEITINTDKDVAVVHDGSTVGGQELVGISANQRITNKDIVANQLNVSGVSTFSGITTVTGPTLFSKQLNVSGVVTATSFIGDGSLLTGIVATGAGVVILDEGALIGVAATINFGTNLSVSPVSAGIVTVSVFGYASEAYVGLATAGLASQSYVGLATAGLASETYVDTQVGLATAGLASETYVDTQVGLATAGLASEAYVGLATAGLASESYVGLATAGLASETYVDTQVGLSTAGLASVNYVDTQVGLATAGLASETYVGLATVGLASVDYVGLATVGLTSVDYVGLATAGLASQSYVGLATVGLLSQSGDGSTLTGLTGAAAATYGNGTVVPQITVDSTGRITGITNVLISGGGGGTSIIVNDSGSLVGTAGTIDFGDGLTVSPVSAGVVTVTASGGGGSLTVKEVASRFGATNVTVSNVSEIRFNNAAGFNVEDETSGVAFVDLGSTFNPWYVSGSTELKATGEEPIEFVAGPGIAITTKPVSSVGIGTTWSKSITITATGDGGSSQWETTNAGIHTLSNVGIGTTNPISALQVERYSFSTGIGTFDALVGVAHTFDSFNISESKYKTVEYTVHLENASNIQSQKVLIMPNGTIAYSHEYGIMFVPSQIVSIGAIVSSGLCEVRFLPSSGISGLTTYTFSRGGLL